MERNPWLRGVLTLVISVTAECSCYMVYHDLCVAWAALSIVPIGMAIVKFDVYLIRLGNITL